MTLGVADIGRARRFYEALGWEASGPTGDNVAFFQLGGIILSLWAHTALAEDAGLSPHGDGFRGVALAHNVRRREDVDMVLAEASAAGAIVVKPGHETFWGGYIGYFADPDSHLWEIAWNPGFQLLEDGSILLPE